MTNRANNRSQLINGNIRRKLTLAGMSVDNFNNDDIYYEMQAAQDAVFQEIKVFERKFNVMLQDGIESYPLRTTFSYNTNLHTAANGANSDPDTEANATTGWSTDGGALSSVATPRTESPGSYAIRHTLATSGDLISLGSLTVTENRVQFVNFWVRASEDCTLTMYMALNDAEMNTPLTFAVTDEWVNIYGYIQLEGDADSLVFYTDLDTAGDWIEFDDFDLFTQTIDISSRKVVGKLKGWTQPSDWKYDLKMVSNEDYLEFKNNYLAQEAVLAASIEAGVTLTIGQPQVATVFDDELHLYPTPTDDNQNEILTIWSYLLGSESLISSTVAPETPDGFDKAIEKYALEEMKGGSGLTMEFKELVRMNRQKVTNKGHILQRQRCM